MVELSILMPVYNEADTIERAITRVVDADLGTDSYELVIVDDGSIDGTRGLLEGRQWPERVRISLADQNRGKGRAVRTALSEARGTYSVVLDADLEYDPSDLRRLLPPLRDGIADAVFGTRSFHAHSSYSFWYVVGNRFLNLATNVLFNAYLTDVYTCYKLMPTELMRSLSLRENDFRIEAEIAARLLRGGARVYEVPISYVARGREEGKKITALDGLRGLLTLFRCRFR
jgi:glycosyltransferase involved in cell wall biosynthesis